MAKRLLEKKECILKGGKQQLRIWNRSRMRGEEIALKGGS